MSTMTEDLDPPMKRRSYGIVRVVPALLLVAIVEVWSKSHLGWPVWLRWSAYALGVGLVRRAIPAPDWAIDFHRRKGFTVVPDDEKARLLRTYWSIPERQVETSVVLADARWADARRHATAAG
jgi:hypothetical protein